MSVLDEKNAGKKLPPMPGAMPPPPGQKEPVIREIPVVVYINGKPVEMGRKEALSVTAQIANILLYLDRYDGKPPEGERAGG